MSDPCAERASAGRLGRWVAPATAVVGVDLARGRGHHAAPVRPVLQRRLHGLPLPDAARYVPRDYLWMYPGVLLTLLFVVLAICLVPWVAPGQRLSAAIAACFSAIGAALISRRLRHPADLRATCSACG